MKTTSNAMKRAGCLLLALGLPQLASAQTQTPIAPLASVPITPAPLAPRMQVDAANTANGLRLHITAANCDVVELLHVVAAKAKVNVIISDDVRGTISGGLEMQNISPRFAVEEIARKAGMSYGSVGDSTFLVVQMTERHVYFQVPPSDQLAPSQAPVIVIAPPKVALAPDPNHPRWSPFQFNGDKYYQVPLAAAGAGPSIAR